MSTRFVGVTVLPEYFQHESVDGVLDNLVQRAGVTAIATSPYVMAEADELTGSREPPIDAGAGKVRLLDRPLWGKRELWVRTAPSFRPQAKFYEGLRYQPPPTTQLTEQGPIIDQVIAAAKSRGLEVYFQLQAAIPPGYRVQFGGPQSADLPLLPDGSHPRNRVANNASLASPQLLAYQQALIRDLYHAYPDIDGIRFDWPEYPPYRLDSMFVDFSDHVREFATQQGFSDEDFDEMRDDAETLYRRWHGGLTNEDLERLLASDPQSGWRAVYSSLPGVANMLELKARLSDSLLRVLRTTMDEVSDRKWKLAPSAFPPPWSYVSGFDFERSRATCDAVSVKLYGMHWAMMLKFYGEQILAANTGLSESLLTRSLVRLLDIADDDGFDSLSHYQYPGPDEPHPVGANAQRRKIATAQAAAGATPVHVLAHGYGPLNDFKQRIGVANSASQYGFWVNRYCYLSDAKLDAIGDCVRGE